MDLGQTKGDTDIEKDNQRVASGQDVENLTRGSRDDESEFGGDDDAVKRLVVAGEDGARRRRLALAHDGLRARVPVPQQHRAVLQGEGNQVIEKLSPIRMNDQSNDTRR